MIRGRVHLYGLAVMMKFIVYIRKYFIRTVCASNVQLTL